MKVIQICGTNGVGKTTLVKGLLNTGKFLRMELPIDGERKEWWFDGQVAVIGRYAQNNCCGVDASKYSADQLIKVIDTILAVYEPSTVIFEDIRFGGSYTDKAGQLVAGNTFDYPSVHGASVLRLGFPFCSMSAEAFCADTTLSATYRTLDLICGAQLTTKSGRGAYPARFSVFPDNMQTALGVWTRRGGNVIVSGSRIATDVWGNVYGVKRDSVSLARTQDFVRRVLGYRYVSSHGTNVGMLADMPFYREMNQECYAVPDPDGITASDSGGSVWLRYGSSGVPAAVRYRTDTYKVVSFGVPLECLKHDPDRDRVIRGALEFFGLYGNADGPGSYQFGFLFFNPSDLRVPGFRDAV